MSGNLSELSGRKGLKHNLFNLLGAESEKTGTIDTGVLQEISEDFLFGTANIYGTVSFYDFLKEENKGKKAYACNGSACLLAGTQDKVLDELKKEFKDEEIGEMCCLGRCHENSSFHYDGKNYSGNDIKDLNALIESKEERQDKYFVGCKGPDILTNTFPTWDDVESVLGKMTSTPREQLLSEIKTSGVRGRGGAGFPMGFKLDFVKNAKGTQKYIVCNADEGDPGAYSDRWVMNERPLSLLLGMIIAGYVSGADKGVVYIRGEYPESVDIIQDAVNKLRELKWIGSEINGSGFTFDFWVVKARGAYICGEETALLSSIEGQRPEVRIRPPYPAQEGLFNKPTAVNNVETLACLPWILKNGGEAFKNIGRGKSTGTKLVCLDGFFNRPGMYEVEMGTPLATVINELGQGFRKPVKAMHIGGPLGGLVPVSKINDLTVDFESFAENGFLLGHASVICIPEEYPILHYLEHLFQFTSHESCGKCFPCRLGAFRGMELLRGARTEGRKIDRVLFDDLVETLEIGSLCALGGGLPLPVKNALQYFDTELKEYFTNSKSVR